MTHKETLFFVAKCLTISLEEANRNQIKNQLKTSKIDWEAVVKLSTTHYVFPALYCNFKRVDFLKYLPEDLVVYMKHITDLNRERNQQILSQAKEINQLLLDNNITPIFLKGTGNLLEGLYEDIGERMVGDIDFIFSEDAYPKAIKILEEFNYSKVTKTAYNFPSFKHHPRLQKENNIAAVEIHKEILIEKYAKEFNYTIVNTDAQFINNIKVMSFENQFSLSIIAKQINDSGFHYNNIALRNAYDVFLLSKKVNSLEVFHKFNQLKTPLNCFLATCYEVFNKPFSLQYKKNKKTVKYVSKFYKLLNNKSWRHKKNKKTTLKLFLFTRINIIYKSIFDKEHRNWLFKRITDKNWQQEKLIQFGFKKPKQNS